MRDENFGFGTSIPLFRPDQIIQRGKNAASSAAPARQIQIMPMGVIQGRDGRGPFRLDNLAHAQSVVAASLVAAGKTQIPVDYDHQIPFGARDGVGGTAPASGWITTMMAKADGIFADVEWTSAAAQKIRAKEYRYVSPYFSYEKETGKVTRIWNVGLVNLPNFTDLAAVAASSTPGVFALTPEERRLCAITGNSETNYLASKRQLEVREQEFELGGSIATAAMSAEDRAVMRQLGVSEASYFETKRRISADNAEQEAAHAAWVSSRS